MSKIKFAKLVVILILLLSSLNLWSGGSTYPPQPNHEFPDRFRNVPAVSSQVGLGASTNMIYCTSFGLLPYRLSRDLQYTDAFLFRSTISNEEYPPVPPIQLWYFNDLNLVTFDTPFLLANSPALVALTGYDGTDYENMQGWFNLDEANARYYGGTGSWASPVLAEAQGAVIVLNKSGILMCIEDDFTTNQCVRWSENLRIQERLTFLDDSSKHEFMATPTILGNTLYIAGIYNISKVDLFNQNPTEYVSVINDPDDHLLSPIAFDLNDNPYLICTSYNGRLVIVDEYLNIQETMSLGNDITIKSKPLIDADGQVYIAASNGKIFYFDPTTIGTGEFEVLTISCTNETFVSTLITDGTKNIYAFTEDNDILEIEENYDFSLHPDDPVVNTIWGNEYLYQHLDDNYRAINNHSILYERFNDNTSCLQTIYNDGNYNFVTDEDYYYNFNPNEFSIIVRYINTLNSFWNTEYEQLEQSATFGGISSYTSSDQALNSLWLDEHGYVWSYNSYTPTGWVGYSEENISPLVSNTGFPKFMKGLPNVIEYDQTDFTLIVHDQDPEDYETFFMNSIECDEFYANGDNIEVKFYDLINHQSYTLGIVPENADPIAFENIDTSLGQYDYYTEIYISGWTSWSSSNTNLYQHVFIEPNATLSITGYLGHTLISLFDLTIYNEGTLLLGYNSSLNVLGTIYSVQETNETGEGLIDKDASSNIYTENIEVDQFGNLKIEAYASGDFEVNNFSIDVNGITTIDGNGPSLDPICYISDEITVNGTFEDNATIQFGNGATCFVSGSNALFNVIGGIVDFKNSNISVSNEASFIIDEDSDAAELNLTNCTLSIDGYGTVFEVHDSNINLNNSDIDITNGGLLKLDHYDDNSQGSELNLSNTSVVTITGDTSNNDAKLEIDWGSKITGDTATIYPGEGEDPIPGDKIIAENGGIISTYNLSDYEQHPQYPNVPEVLIETTSGDEDYKWDGIYIENPDEAIEYWFVNCDITGILKLSIDNVGLGADNTAKLNLHFTDFTESGQIVARDGHHLTIAGSESQGYCSINDNSGCPIYAYRSPVFIDYVWNGTMQSMNNGAGIYVYDSSDTLSYITNSSFTFNNGTGLTLNNVLFSEFSNNQVNDNNGFGMLCYDGTSFDGDLFSEITIEDNGYAEYVGWHHTFSMENPAANIQIADDSYGISSDQYLLMNVNWDSVSTVGIQGTNIVMADTTHLFPSDPDAWAFGGESSAAKELLNLASNDIFSKNFSSAEQILQQIITDYPLTQEAGSAVFYLYHLESLTDQNYSGLIDYLENINAEEKTPLESAIDKIITKSFMKDKEYIIAIDRLESVISNSPLPDEVVAAMIDQGYCYLELAEQGERALPEKCTIKTKTLDSYQAVVRDLETQFSFYPNGYGNDIPQIGKISSALNYPNPFNPTTTISFNLSSESVVSVNVYNLKGQKVKQLISDRLDAGEHTLLWNGRNDSNKSVSSGIYFYKITTDKDSEIKKMLLLK